MQHRISMTIKCKSESDAPEGRYTQTNVIRQASKMERYSNNVSENTPLAYPCLSERIGEIHRYIARTPTGGPWICLSEQARSYQYQWIQSWIPQSSLSNGQNIQTVEGDNVSD